MDIYFFDSSAIIKSYLIETGTTWCKNITDHLTDNRICLAQITMVEVISAITRQARNGNISITNAALAINQFLNDFNYRYTRIQISSRLTHQAATLTQTYALRGYDAVQLAAAIQIHQQRVRLALSPITLISSDIALNSAALAEGLLVEDPNSHP